ncbi:MAG: alkaline phosphatase family protein, partial [Candidatus Nanohaloarchaea archaeon]|nr:alkaline phosphatase family protein [Candidatus Nanohaloarchaea archaeon]
MMEDTKWVVFIDSLSPRDLSRTEFLQNSMKGKMHATAPRVTPRVMSSIYTGLDPAENGMMRSQMFGVEDATRPQQTTVMERAMANDMDVLSLYMPFSIPMNLHSGSAGIGTAMGGQQSAGPQQMIPQMTVPGPQGDLIGDQRHDIVFDHFVDYTTQLFSTARTLAPNYDVVFIGFRLIDSYCHFQYDCNEEGRGAGQGNRYRDKLAEVIDIQLQQLLPRGDVLWFSDHGATKKKETFYINQWLKEKGYLTYEVDTDFIDQAKEYGMMQGEQHPVNVRVEN